MDTIFTDAQATRGNQARWSFDQGLLLTTLSQAMHDATRLGRAVLASVTQSVEMRNPFYLWRTFAGLEIGDGLFWSQPAERKTLIGMGAAATLEARGSERCTTAAASWRALLSNAVVRYASDTMAEQSGGPTLLGGFSFDPLRPGTALWEGFPDGLLILPQILIHYRGDHCTLTVNRVVQPVDQDCITESMALLQRIQAAMENRAPEERESDAQLQIQNILPAEVWKGLVSKTAQKIREGQYEKVVLARAVEVTRAGMPFAIDETLRRLSESYPGAYVFAFQRGSRYFMGATPERLVLSQHGQLRAMALAGSMRRGATEEEDAQLGVELLQSGKNQIEHSLVVEMMREALSNVCSKIWVADTPHLRRLKNIQHLETALVGEILPGRCILEAIDGLFPTPAVGGVPRESALALIREEEQLDRGWYAGAIGCIDADGNGEFAVALRSALIEGEKATLFGGCGIVGDSDPESEYTESCWKLQVMLHGLCGED